MTMLFLHVGDDGDEDVVWSVVTDGGGVVGIVVVAPVCWAIVTYGENDDKSSSGIAGMASSDVLLLIN